MPKRFTVRLNVLQYGFAFCSIRYGVCIVQTRTSECFLPAASGATVVTITCTVFLFSSDLQHEDAELLAIARWLHDRDPEGQLIASVFRKTFDQLYDGQHTGRYRLDQLFKTEKTHFGTLFEINLQRALSIPDGEILDYKILGIEVDCKYSHTGAWMLPIESFDRLILVGKADDSRSVWSLGIVRVAEENRRKSENRDKKTGLNQYGREQIVWIFHEAPMPPNALLQLPAEQVQAIMSLPSGQRRINELLETAVNMRLTRNTIATVAQQDDFMKRLRDNGGARGALRPKGYLILGGDYKIQTKIAENLGAEIPLPGEVISVRVVPSVPGEGTEISGTYWRLAAPGEEASAEAPVLPRK